MSLLRRSGAALLGVLLLQLSLLGSGTLCAMRDGATSTEIASVHQSHEMRGMTTDGMAPRHEAAYAAAAPRSDAPSAPQGCGSSDGPGDCRLPWAPGQCATMMTCATAVAQPSAIVAEIAVSHGNPELPEPASFHSGPGVAPELPPPRA